MVILFSLVGFFHPITGLENPALFAANSRIDILHLSVYNRTKNVSASHSLHPVGVLEAPSLAGCLSFLDTWVLSALGFHQSVFSTEAVEADAFRWLRGLQDHCWALAGVPAFLGTKKKFALLLNWASPCWKFSVSLFPWDFHAEIMPGNLWDLPHPVALCTQPSELTTLTGCRQVDRKKCKTVCVWGCIICALAFAQLLNTATLFLEFDLRQEEYTITSTPYAAVTMFKEKKNIDEITNFTCNSLRRSGKCNLLNFFFFFFNSSLAG